MAETNNAAFEDGTSNPQLNEWKKLSAEECVRGTMPAGIEKRCLNLCQSYLAGSWANATSVADITVKRISGGLTNQLYHVQLNDTVKRVPNSIYSDEPFEVAIKLYQEKHIKNYRPEESERHNDMLILTIMSLTGLGPQIYGIFSDGFIQGYYKHKQFRAKHQQNPDLLRRLASIIARIHQFQVPISKQVNLLFAEIPKMIDFALQNYPEIKLIKELNLPTLQSKDLHNEVAYLMAQIDKLNSPIVFCHNDFRGSNILVIDESKEEILVCDFEHCGYGSRAFDLATFLTEWGNEELFQINPTIPTDEQIGTFLKLYIEECDKLIPGYSTKPENSLETLLKETKVMILVNWMFFVAFMIKNQESLVPTVPFDPKKKMFAVEHLFKLYMEIKGTLINDKTITI